MGVVLPGRLECDAAQRQTRGDHRGETLQLLRERVVGRRVGDGRRDRALAVERHELPPQPVGLLASRSPPTGTPDPMTTTPPSVPIASSMRDSTSPHTPGAQKPYWSGPSIAATGTFAVASVGCSWPVSDSPCSGLSARARGIEIAAHPAGQQRGVRRADLPEVTRGEVRLVGMGVADRRQHADLALAVQLRERRERRMPAQPARPRRTPSRRRPRVAGAASR